jgi:hypothetical protein
LSVNRHLWSPLLDGRTSVCRVRPVMRRSGLQVRFKFAPTRLSSKYMSEAYECVVPVVERAVGGDDIVEGPPVNRDGTVEADVRRTAQRRRA